ncbi:MAG: hypothetical protein AB7K09_07585 [Planctomycetota bacterium]
MTTDDLVIGDYTHDDAIIAATRADGQLRVRVYRLPEPVVVLGKGSKVDRELDVSACLADKATVLRRSGGGCAVVIDPGNLIVAVTIAAEGLGGNKRRFDLVSEWLIDGLARSGVPGVVRAGTSDLALDDRKISGSCIHQWKDLVYYSATLLVEPDVELMTRWLQHPPREPDYRRGRSHADFVTGVASKLDDADDATAVLHARLQAVLDSRVKELIAALAAA